jgi:hypothetical protein
MPAQWSHVRSGFSNLTASALQDEADKSLPISQIAWPLGYQEARRLSRMLLSVGRAERLGKHASQHEGLSNDRTCRADDSTLRSSVRWRRGQCNLPG